MSKDNKDLNNLTTSEVLSNLKNDSNDLTFDQMTVYKRLVNSRMRIGKTKDLIVDKE